MPNRLAVISLLFLPLACAPENLAGESESETSELGTLAAGGVRTTVVAEADATVTSPAGLVLTETENRTARRRTRSVARLLPRTPRRLRAQRPGCA